MTNIETESRRALIVGGGIAGAITAMALQQAGIDSVVYEAYNRTSDGVGAFLTIAKNGQHALRALDLHDQVCDLGMATPAVQMRSVGRGKGKVLGEFTMPARTLTRADLYQTLRDEAVRRGVRIEYGKRLDDATMTPSGVRISFTDGTTAEGDLLIGADGLHSRTRKTIDPGAPSARYLGLLNTGGFAGGVNVAGRAGVSYFLFGKRCFFGYVIHPNGDVWWFANPPSPQEPTRQELAAITPEQWRAKLHELFAGDVGPMHEIIDGTEHIIPPWGTYDFPSVPVWRNERMVLIGDAAHATSPSSGQGASMAIEDAVTLAKCLRDLPGTGAPLAAYEKLRRERVEKVVAQGKRNGSGKAPGAVGAILRDLILPMVAKRLATKNALGWIYNYEISWTTPTPR